MTDPKRKIAAMKDRMDRIMEDRKREGNRFAAAFLEGMDRIRDKGFEEGKAEGLAEAREALFMLSEPWSLPDCVERLCNATDYLLHDLGSDRHGHEADRDALFAAEKWIKKLRADPHGEEVLRRQHDRLRGEGAKRVHEWYEPRWIKLKALLEIHGLAKEACDIMANNPHTSASLEAWRDEVRKEAEGATDAVMSQRDAAEDALTRANAMLGKHEWSNLYGYDEFLEDLALRLDSTREERIREVALTLRTKSEWGYVELLLKKLLSLVGGFAHDTACNVLSKELEDARREAREDTLADGSEADALRMETYREAGRNEGRIEASLMLNHIANELQPKVAVGGPSALVYGPIVSNLAGAAAKLRDTAEAPSGHRGCDLLKGHTCPNRPECIQDGCIRLAERDERVLHRELNAHDHGDIWRAAAGIDVDANVPKPIPQPIVSWVRELLGILNDPDETDEGFLAKLFVERDARVHREALLKASHLALNQRLCPSATVCEGISEVEIDAWARTYGAWLRELAGDVQLKALKADKKGS